jgi:hypothetical protein
VGSPGIGRLVPAALVAVAALAVSAPGRTERAPAVAACTGADQIDFACYQRRYRDLVAVRGPKPAIRDLTDRAGRIGYVGAACHQLMHGIGRDAGRRSGISAFEQGDDSCSSGFFHGVVESVMTRMGADALSRSAASVCAPFRARRRDLALYNCVHGMGHGFMAVHQTDVFKSLDGCRGLADAWERRHCEGGVFMQNLTAMSSPDRPARQLRPDQPLYPCTAVARRYKHECYIKQTAYALLVRSDDFGAVFDLCAGSPDVSYRADCYEGIGGDASIRASKYVNGAAARRSTVRTLCRLGRDRPARRNCVIGAVTVTVRDGASQSANPAALCASFHEAYLRAACSRAHLKTVQEFAAGNVIHARGDSPRLLCDRATGLEAASAGVPRPRDRSETQ